jgi:hypothetical protein
VNPLRAEEIEDNPTDARLGARAFAEHLSERAGSSADPAEHGRKVAAQVCPVMLPYQLGTQASFNQYRFNGRPLHIDAFDVMLTLGANKAIADGVSPDRERIINSFPTTARPITKPSKPVSSPSRPDFTTNRTCALPRRG